ncbi:response regulator transcription factor [Leptolinea tardivitalis]|uniref:DNA-binding protein n=1 Tax=Leptolinea tardivitalis TaxID=229920 RepID=A0A0P6WUX4_9CHLR|nr:response regulator transcription factor [Leptolinea tardivitalis]KPL70404.1 DNA-binding protein [Leptolinea tardivitalis]GAP21973.1 response regulator consisting of a CheY-like receiver domain and a winged-helix DNA-binding domain [Leptolinea tardivitalis]
MEDIYQSRLLIVDDEPELRKMLKDILQKDGFLRIFSAATCQQARQVFNQEHPDAIILDVILPDGDGFSLFREFRSVSPIPVLFLSARDEDEDRLLGLGLGADDYITKPFLPRELMLRLKTILNRVYFPFVPKQEVKPVFQLGDTVIDLNKGTVTRGDNSTTLTAKEFALLEKLYENHGRIVTGDSLCRAAWGDNLYSYENTLMVHIRRLREKIEFNPSQPRYLLTIRGLGYKLVSGEDI